MRYLRIVFLTTTTLLASPCLPTAYEAHPNDFTIRAPNYSAIITPSEAQIRLSNDTTIRFHAIHSVAQLQPGPALPARVNYISRSTSATYQLHSNVRWHTTYPGVDLIFRDNPDHFEYDVELAPGASLAPVALAFDGVDNIRIDQRTGDLILTAAGRESVSPNQSPINSTAASEHPSTSLTSSIPTATSASAPPRTTTNSPSSSIRS